MVELKPLLMVVMLASGFAVGFGLVLFWPGGSWPAFRSVSVDYGNIECSIRFDDPTVRASELTCGWGRQEPGRVDVRAAGAAPTRYRHSGA